MLVLAISIFAAIAIFLKAETVFWLNAITIFIVSGVLKFYAGSDAAVQAVYFTSVIVFVHINILSKKADQSHGYGINSRPLFLVFLVYFFIILLASSISNNLIITQLLTGFKNYCAIWLLFFSTLRLLRDKNFLLRLENAVIAISLIQVPFVIQQAMTYRNWDSVVGTYGGTPEGGGASGLLMFFSVVAVTIAISKWQSGRLKFVHLLCIVCANLFVVGAAEVKAFIFLLPTALFVQQIRMLFRRPVVFVTLIFACMAVSWGLVHVYEVTYQLRAPGRIQLSSEERILDSLSYFWDQRNINWETGEVGRGASLNLWLNDAQTDPVRTLFGYGAGASRSKSSVVTGSVAQRFSPLDIASTAIAQLLWDTGVIGTSLFILSLFSSCLLAMKNSFRAKITTDQHIFSNISSLICIVMIGLVYDRSLIDLASGQFAMVCFYAVLASMVSLLNRHSDSTIISGGR